MLLRIKKNYHKTEATELPSRKIIKTEVNEVDEKEGRRSMD